MREGHGQGESYLKPYLQYRVNVILRSPEEWMADNIIHEDAFERIMLRQRPDQIPGHFADSRRHQFGSDSVFDITLSHAVDTTTT